MEVAVVCPCDTPPPRGVAPPASLHKQHQRGRSGLVCGPLATKQLVPEARSCSLPHPQQGPWKDTSFLSPVRPGSGPSPALRPTAPSGEATARGTPGRWCCSGDRGGWEVAVRPSDIFISVRSVRASRGSPGVSGWGQRSACRGAVPPQAAGAAGPVGAQPTSAPPRGRPRQAVPLLPGARVRSESLRVAITRRCRTSRSGRPAVRW